MDWNTNSYGKLQRSNSRGCCSSCSPRGATLANRYYERKDTQRQQGEGTQGTLSPIQLQHPEQFGLKNPKSESDQGKPYKPVAGYNPDNERPIRLDSDKDPRQNEEGEKNKHE